jgi:mannitol-specific phosphotransferase system IIBC component
MRGRIGSPHIRIAATALIENPNLTLQQSLAIASDSKKQAADLQRQKKVSKQKCRIMKAANEQNNNHQSENKENINIIIISSSSNGTGVSSMTSSSKKKSSKSTATKTIPSLRDKPLASKSQRTLNHVMAAYEEHNEMMSFEKQHMIGHVNR